MTENFQICGRTIGHNTPTYIIAEVSGNHNQSMREAVKLIRTAKEVGADAVKLQTYTADTLTIDCRNHHFRIKGTLWEGQTLYELYRTAYTPWDWHAQLKQVAEQCGLHFFSTAFDHTAVEFLENLGVPLYKVASFENIDLALLKKVASTGKPVILSTGMATLGELEEAVKTLKENGSGGLALLKCTSSYPAEPENMNLRTIPHLESSFSVPVGLSDHSMGIEVPVTAVALGACIIEKHLTLSRAKLGPDSGFSLEPAEFGEMVRAVRNTEKALGAITYGPTPAEEPSLRFRRSLFIVKNMKKGEEFSENNVRSIRPGYGLHPRYYEQILGRRVQKKVSRGTPLQWDLIIS